MTWSVLGRRRSACRSRGQEYCCGVGAGKYYVAVPRKKMSNKAAAAYCVMHPHRVCRQKNFNSLFKGLEMLFTDTIFGFSLFCVGRVPFQRWCTELSSVFPACTFLYNFPMEHTFCQHMSVHEFPTQQEKILVSQQLIQRVSQMVIQSAPYS